MGKKVKDGMPLFAIRVYCGKCNKFLMESLRITHKQLVCSWDDAVFKACSIYCTDCGTKPPALNKLMIYNYGTGKEIEPKFFLPNPNYDMIKDAKHKLGIPDTDGE